MIELFIWGGVPVHQALSRFVVDRLRLRTHPFAHLVSTSRGFDVASTDLHRWLLAVRAEESFETSPVVRGWDAIAAERASLTLRPLVSKGTWDGVDPFGTGHRWDGPVLSLTRARLAPLRARRFRRAVPPVTSAVLAADGLRWSAGFGQVPLRYEGTLSVWASSAAASDFAYRTDVHTEVLRRTPDERWYREDLFARFGLVSADGTLDGLPARELAAA